MTMSPILWGAGLACALGGALAGNAVGSTPVTDRSTIAMFYQSHETALAGREDGRILPNHYPLVTRNGVVEVAQLSDRGLFSQARYRSADIAAAYASDDYNYPDAMIEKAPSVPTEDYAEAVVPAEPASPVQGSSNNGQAKIIDVETALAMR